MHVDFIRTVTSVAYDIKRKLNKTRCYATQDDRFRITDFIYATWQAFKNDQTIRL